MTQTESIPDWAMEMAVSIEKDIPSRVTGANRVFIRAVVARALASLNAAAEARGMERAAVIAEERHRIWGTPAQIQGFEVEDDISACREIADAIRTAKDQP